MNFNYLNKGKILKILDKKITKISFIIIIIIISLLVLVTYTNSQNNIQISNTENNTYADIDNFIKEKITSSGIPGLAIGIVHNNKVIYLKGYGTADVSGRKVTPQTPFIIGSATKSFTALSILQLAQQNKISLDAPVQKYIPYFKVDDQTASSKITIRQLLNQTSGLETKTGYVGNFSNNTTLEQRVRQLSDIKIMNQPGSTFAYCNENYAVLGLVIEKISGKSYGNFVATNTFEPLEMINSYTDIDIAINNGISDGHQSFFGVPITTKPNYPKYLISDGYIITSAQDMTKYLIMNMNNGEYNNISILSPKLHAELFKPSTSDNYGMGWFNDSSYGIKTLNHGGDVKNFHTEMLIDQKNNNGLIILINTNDISGYYSADIYNITSGIINRLANTKAETYQSIQNYMKAIYILLILFLLFQIHKLTTIKSWYIKNKSKFSKKFTIKTIVVGAITTAIPLLTMLWLLDQAGASLPTALSWQPDITIWLIAFTIIIFIKNAIKICLVIISKININKELKNPSRSRKK